MTKKRIEPVNLRRPRAIGLLLPVIASTVAFSPADADTVDARCDIYRRGEDKLEKMIPCTFSQRQGHVVIRREDGQVHDLVPTGDRTGNFTDQYGRRVYRQSGLADQGLIFRLPDESVYVYWNTAALEPATGEDNWASPFSTEDYDATTRLPCRAAGDDEFGSCPAGILRMENGQASIVVQNQLGHQFTINFLKDAASGERYVNATNRSVDARLDGDMWTLTIDGYGSEVWKVPLAAIEGG